MTEFDSFALLHRSPQITTAFPSHFHTTATSTIKCAAQPSSLLNAQLLSDWNLHPTHVNMVPSTVAPPSFDLPLPQNRDQLAAPPLSPHFFSLFSRLSSSSATQLTFFSPHNPHAPSIYPLTYPSWPHFSPPSRFPPGPPATLLPSVCSFLQIQSGYPSDHSLQAPRYVTELKS